MEKNSKKYFTQKELEKHINARLVRERKKNPELMLFKKMADELIAKGVIDADSYAEAAERIMAMLERNTAVENKEEESMGKEVKENMENEVTDIVSENGYDRDINLYTSHDDNGISAGEDGEASLEEPDVAEETDSTDLPFGLSGEKNEKADDGISEERGGTEDKASEYEVLSEICNSLLKLVNSEKGKKEESAKNARRAACSTGFSGERSADTFAFDTQLTPLQREIAKSAGLTYREYARLLGEIPENTKKRRQKI